MTTQISNWILGALAIFRCVRHHYANIIPQFLTLLAIFQTQFANFPLFVCGANFKYLTLPFTIQDHHLEIAFDLPHWCWCEMTRLHCFPLLLPMIIAKCNKYFLVATLKFGSDQCESSEIPHAPNRIGAIERQLEMMFWRHINGPLFWGEGQGVARLAGYDIEGRWLTTRILAFLQWVRL